MRSLRVIFFTFGVSARQKNMVYRSVVELGVDDTARFFRCAPGPIDGKRLLSVRAMGPARAGAAVVGVFTGGRAGSDTPSSVILPGDPADYFPGVDVASYEAVYAFFPVSSETHSFSIHGNSTDDVDVWYRGGFWRMHCTSTLLPPDVTLVVPLSTMPAVTKPALGSSCFICSSTVPPLATPLSISGSAAAIWPSGVANCT